MRQVRLQAIVVGVVVAAQALMAAVVVCLDRGRAVSGGTLFVASAAACALSAWIVHRWAMRGLSGPLQELIVLVEQIAEHPDVSRLRSRIREIALLEDSIRRMAAEMSDARLKDGSAVLSADSAHELRSSLGAVKNALYYVKEVSRDHGLPEKDPALLQIFEHAELEIEKAAKIAAAQQEKIAGSEKGGPRGATA